MSLILQEGELAPVQHSHHNIQAVLENYLRTAFP